MSLIANLEKMLAAGADTAPLRYGLADALFKNGEAKKALAHIERALAIDPTYSAAWKLHGRLLVALDQPDQAIAVYEQGIRVAETRGDRQAVKEMEVFLRRLRKPKD
ncbi:MAG: TPR repeat-containing protein [Gammaproteobacteria bacterium]|nr:MAG: TPR repeat-containing protein [Gammaproteobacteria bacterium]TND04051.1 MAG: TPR repeat-containing protein [Gammaproteobacteria bacterium]